MKTCALCDRAIPYYHKLCAEHFAQFKEYLDTTWFQELEKMQLQQDRINKKECSLLPYNAAVDIRGEYKQYPVSDVKEQGRPPIHYSIADQVLQIYDSDNTLSLRRISQLLEGKVSHQTVSNIINKYRK